MTRVRSRGEDVRRYILDNVEKNNTSISKATAAHFGITRQAVNKHLQRLTEENELTEAGKTRNRTYKLSPQVEWRRTFRIEPGLSEGDVWTQDVKPALGHLPDNVMEIWHHGFTEMFNNAIDHSGGATIFVQIRKTAAGAEMLISDDGIGIFKKIQMALKLLDERHSVLELAKGKFTTDPKRHSGEGIFFTSRMFDLFDILSGGVYFSHEIGAFGDWIAERDKFDSGTSVWMKIHNHTARTVRKIFDQFSGGDDYKFEKTIVPVKLAKYGDDNLISRSQAKRLLARIELFRIVLFDFSDVDSIGQAFADEIFRVFQNEHPKIIFHVAHANSQVKRMIERVKSGAIGETPPAS